MRMRMRMRVRSRTRSVECFESLESLDGIAKWTGYEFEFGNGMEWNGME